MLNSEIDIFRMNIWDGLVGLGCDRNRASYLKGDCITDRLLESDDCKEKTFTFNILKYRNDSSILFCERPSFIENYDKEVYWAPV